MSTAEMFPNPRHEIDAAIRTVVGDYESEPMNTDVRGIVNKISEVEFSPACEKWIRDQGLMRLAHDTIRANVVKTGAKLRSVKSAAGDRRAVIDVQMTLFEIQGWIDEQRHDLRGIRFEIDVAEALRDEMIREGYLVVGEIPNDRIAEIRAEIAERYAS